MPADGLDTLTDVDVSLGMDVLSQLMSRLIPGIKLPVQNENCVPR